MAFTSVEQQGASPSSRSKSKETSVYPGPIEGSHLTAKDRYYDGYVSPSPRNDMTAERRDERRYRLNLTHPYHESLKLPCKHGVNLHPHNTSLNNPLVWTPSQVFIGDIGYHKRPHGSFVRLFSAFDVHESRRYSFLLRTGHKRSMVVAESTVYVRPHW